MTLCNLPLSRLTLLEQNVGVEKLPSNLSNSVTHFLLLWMNKHSKEEIVQAEKVELFSILSSYLPIRGVACILISLPWNCPCPSSDCNDSEFVWYIFWFNLVVSIHKILYLLHDKLCVSVGSLRIAKKGPLIVRKNCCTGDLSFLLGTILLWTSCSMKL